MKAYLPIYAISYMKLTSCGAWVAQLVKHLTSAQVMVSWSVTSSPTLGCVLTAQSLEPASDSLSFSLSAPPLLMLCLKDKLTGRLPICDM